ncbi:MAG: permease prefix domain 1-containing protein [Limisphaerales bacterium]
MENQTRIDLNAAIENWRHELAEQPHLASDDRRELESHLRDAIAGFQQRGLTDEESFWLARRRVGQLPQISEEFEKADPAKVWRERIFWILLAYLVITLWGQSVNCIFRALVNLNGPALGGLLIANIFDYVFHWMPLVVGAVLLARGKYTSHFESRFAYFRTRRSFAAIAIAWCLINLVLFLWHDLQYLYASPFNNEIQRVVVLNILSSSVYMIIIPMTLVSLLLWLMPAQNRKTPERA